MLEASVTKVFGENLRLLCSSKTSISGVARELEINRVQFHRYLNGEAYPKPAELKKICAYFGVDARILLEPLQCISRPPLEETNFLVRAIKEIPALMDSALFPTDLPNGLYMNWRWSMSKAKDLVVATCYQVKTEADTKIIRAYIDKAMFVDGNAKSLEERELRGIVVKQKDGFALSVVQPTQQPLMAHIFLSNPHETGAMNVYKGYMALMRSEYFDRRRISRCVFQRLEDTKNAIPKAAHLTGWHQPSNVPPHILDELERPL